MIHTRLLTVTPEEKERCIKMMRATFVTSKCCENMSSADMEWLANEVWINAVSSLMVEDKLPALANNAFALRVLADARRCVEETMTGYTSKLNVTRDCIDKVIDTLQKG